MQRPGSRSHRNRLERSEALAALLVFSVMLVVPSGALAEVDGPHSSTYEAIAKVVLARLSHETEPAHVGEAFVENEYAIVSWGTRDEGGEALVRRRPDGAGRPTWTIVAFGGGSLTFGPNAMTELTRTYGVPRAIAIRLLRDVRSVR